MDNKPDISVVMPCYNRAHLIQNAVRSVVDQTFVNWELIVIDDGSTDNLKRVIDNFANPRIRYFNQNHCGFVSRVRNYGNQQARGELIVVHDSDDVAFPDRLEELWRSYKETNADLLYHGIYHRFYDPYTNAIARTVKPALLYDKQHLLNEQYIPGQVAYKREKILITPYDDRIRCCDDYQMLLEFALNDYTFQPIYKNLYDYIDSPDSINVHGEQDGSRKRDVAIILLILKEKYGINATAGLIKSTITGEVISQEIVS